MKHHPSKNTEEITNRYTTSDKESSPVLKYLTFDP